MLLRHSLAFISGLDQVQAMDQCALFLPFEKDFFSFKKKKNMQLRPWAHIASGTYSLMPYRKSSKLSDTNYA